MRKLFSLVLILGLFTSGAEAKIFRSSKAKHEFMRLSGYPKGRPGYVIDHIIPLCAGGLDAPSNMQWMEREAAILKDVFEKIQRRVTA